MAMYHVDITNKGDSVFIARSKDAEFAIDTRGRGVTPPDTLLASLGSCVGVYIRKYFDGAKIPLGEFSINVDADFAKDPPISFREIRVAIDLKGAVLDERRRNALLGFIKNCPVHNTLEGKPGVDVRIL